MAIALVVGLWLARYLGPVEFGRYSYAIAFVSLFSVIASMGLNNIVVRDIVRDPLCANETLGTSCALQFLGGMIAFILILAVLSKLQFDDGLTKVLIIILGSSLVFKSSDVIKYWFESQVQSHYVVWTETSIYLGISAAKIGLILIQAPVIAFIWVLLTEAVLVAMGLLYVYTKRQGSVWQWSVNVRRAKELFKDSWSLILSGLSVVLYMRIDQIMLGEMIGSRDVGIYSAAVKISEIWNMIPVIVVSSLFPAILKAKSADEDIYQDRMRHLLDFLAIVAFVIVITVSLFSDWIIILLYGPAYAQAGDVLMIHVWTCLFVFMGFAGNKWYLAENLQHLILYRVGTGALINIALNLVLIPRYGIEGAAWATVISQSISGVFLNAVKLKTRPIFLIQIRSLTGVSLLQRNLLGK